MNKVPFIIAAVIAVFFGLALRGTSDSIVIGGGRSIDTYGSATTATSTVNTTSTRVLDADANATEREIWNMSGSVIYCKKDGVTTAASSTLALGAGFVIAPSSTQPSNRWYSNGYTGVVNCLGNASGTVLTITN